MIEKGIGKMEANSENEKNTNTLNIIGSKTDYNEIIKSICQGYKESPENLLELIKFKSQFYKYSFNNTILIYEQNPNASFVQSFTKWKEMNQKVDGKDISVKRGEHGIRIFVPVIQRCIKIDDERTVSVSEAKKQFPKAYDEYSAGRCQAQDMLVGFRIGSVFDISQTTFPKELYPSVLHVGFSDQYNRECVEGLVEY